MAVFRHEVSFGLPLSAGVTIYVAASDLIPEVNKEPGVKMAHWSSLERPACFCWIGFSMCTNASVGGLHQKAAANAANQKRNIGSTSAASTTTPPMLMCFLDTDPISNRRYANPSRPWCKSGFLRKSIV